MKLKITVQHDSCLQRKSTISLHVSNWEWGEISFHSSTFVWEVCVCQCVCVGVFWHACRFVYALLLMLGSGINNKFFNFPE